jgi:type III secretion protein Y
VWRDENKEVLQVLADVYLEQGQTDKAVVLLEGLHVLEPHDTQVIKALSYAYLRIGRYDDTLDMVDAFLRLGAPMPENAPILLIRGKALWALGRPTEARDSLKRYLELGGHS